MTQDLIRKESYKGRTDGGVVPSGYAGEMAFSGTSVVNGTGGFSYKAASNTALTASAAELVFLTLNKGNYWVSANLVGSQTDGSTRRVAYSVRIGGTAVTQNLHTDFISGVIGGGQVSVPLTITADNTKVSLYAQIVGLTGASGDNSHEIYAMRAS